MGSDSESRKYQRQLIAEGLRAIAEGLRVF